MKARKQPKKMTLHRETLRLLTLRELEAAAGGRFFDTHTTPEESCRVAATTCC